MRYTNTVTIDLDEAPSVKKIVMKASIECDSGALSNTDDLEEKKTPSEMIEARLARYDRFLAKTIPIMPAAAWETLLVYAEVNSAVGVEGADTVEGLVEGFLVNGLEMLWGAEPTEVEHDDRRGLTDVARPLRRLGEAERWAVSEVIGHARDAQQRVEDVIAQLTGLPADAATVERHEDLYDKIARAFTVTPTYVERESQEYPAVLFTRTWNGETAQICVQLLPDESVAYDTATGRAPRLDPRALYKQLGRIWKQEIEAHRAGRLEPGYRIYTQLNEGEPTGEESDDAPKGSPRP